MNTCKVIYESSGRTFLHSHGRPIAAVIQRVHPTHPWLVISMDEGIVDMAPRFIQALEKAEQYVQFKAIKQVNGR